MMPVFFMQLWVFGTWVLVAIVHISFALAVLQDSQSLFRREQRSTVFVNGVIWALATLLGGVFMAAIYWVIHHSTLRRLQPKVVQPGPPRQP